MNACGGQLTQYLFNCVGIRDRDSGALCVNILCVRLSNSAQEVEDGVVEGLDVVVGVANEELEVSAGGAAKESTGVVCDGNSAVVKFGHATKGIDSSGGRLD